jgi:L-fuculose-phosphate aldolase
MNGPALRRAIVEACAQLHRRGWVANHDGNVSGRLARDRFLATPTSVSKRLVDEGSLVTVDSAGTKVAGQRQIFSEINLHLAAYAARTDVRAVVHAHPPAATARACAGLGFDEPFMPEAVVSIGPRVPLVPFAMPGPEAVRALEPFLGDFDAVLLASHGVLAWGPDVETALLRVELVEHMARIARDAGPYGGVRPLPAEAVPPLLAARARAGLGPEGRARKQPLFARAQTSGEPPPRPAMDAMRRVAGARREG